MAAKEFHSYKEAGNEETTLLQLQVDPYEEEEEETLSLCDLPIYNGSVSARWGDDHFSKEDEKNNDDEDNLFEFFSEEFSTSSNNINATAENIIFCGKLIPFKDIIPRDPRVESNNVQKGSALLPKARSLKSFAGDYTKVSLVRCTTKSRWFLFMFGMSKLSSSTSMELGDIRNRQSRRGPARMFPAAEDGKAVAGVKGKRSCKGMWKLLKSMSLVLGCRSSKIANDVVKAAAFK